MVAQFVDMSQFQPEPINWTVYKEWSKQGDGVSRVAFRTSYSNGYKDPAFDAHRENALSVGIDQIIYYHYAYPQYNNAHDEANWQKQVVGGIRPNDLLVLDFEENVSQANAEWAYEWLVQQENNYGKLPGLYASSAYITERLSDIRLARYPLWLANWQYTPDERPACPLPWASYEFVQYTDKATNVPGIAGSVDANIFLGGSNTMNVPSGWSDDGTILTAPNGHHVIQGFRGWILTHQWDPSNVPLEEVQAVNPVEEYYPSAGGTRQLFNLIGLGWEKDRGVYVIGIGNELKGARAERDKLKAQIITLQAQIATLQQQPGLANLQQINALSAQISTANAKISTLSQVQ